MSIAESANNTCYQNERSDDWDFILDDIIVSNINIDHKKIMEEIKNVEDAGLPLEKESIQDEINYHLCPDCQVLCKIEENTIICEKCGLVREWQQGSDYNAESYNHTNNHYVAFKFIGNGSYGYGKSFIKTCSEYAIFRSNSNKKEFTNLVFQHEGSKPLPNVVSFAADLFDTIIRAGYVYRKNSKRGVMAACLYYACIINKLSRTSKDIAKIMKTEEKYLSRGICILQELNEAKVINIPINHEPLDDYLNRYFPALGISTEYKQFVIDIIRRANAKHMHVNNDCRTTTKCAGTIYLLTRRVKSLNNIDKEFIANKCDNISKTTLIKYYNLLMENSIILKKCFKKHGIRMPIEWKK